MSVAINQYRTFEMLPVPDVTVLDVWPDYDRMQGECLEAQAIAWQGVCLFRCLRGWRQPMSNRGQTRMVLT